MLLLMSTWVVLQTFVLVGSEYHEFRGSASLVAQKWESRSGSRSIDSTEYVSGLRSLNMEAHPAGWCHVHSVFLHECHIASADRQGDTQDPVENVSSWYTDRCMLPECSFWPLHHFHVRETVLGVLGAVGIQLVSIHRSVSFSDVIAWDTIAAILPHKIGPTPEIVDTL